MASRNGRNAHIDTRLVSILRSTRIDTGSFRALPRIDRGRDLLLDRARAMSVETTPGVPHWPAIAASATAASMPPTRSSQAAVDTGRLCHSAHVEVALRPLLSGCREPGGSGCAQWTTSRVYHPATPLPPYHARRCARATFDAFICGLPVYGQASAGQLRSCCDGRWSGELRLAEPCVISSSYVDN